MVTAVKKTHSINISQSQELQVLRKIVEITNSEMDLGAVLKDVVDIMTEMTKADSVFIYLFDDKKEAPCPDGFEDPSQERTRND